MVIGDKIFHIMEDIYIKTLQMRTSDKKKNIQKANILAESLYKQKLAEDYDHAGEEVAFHDKQAYMDGKNCIIVMPYMETSRLFHASKSTPQEAFLGPEGKTVYYQHQAEKFTKEEAEAILADSENKQAFVRELKN